MRFGFTTGSCAAAASKAAAYMLFSGRRKEEITIETPKGIPYHATLEDIKREENKVSCAVKKDGGDDPDATSGTLIYASVTLLEEDNSRTLTTNVDYKNKYQSERIDKTVQQQVVIDGGIGVGRVTRPGLDQPVGNAAINSVPRQMIQKEVSEVCKLFDFHGVLKVLIEVPEGEKLADQTFNPRLGIVGGISILGTSGIVEPMSSQALLDTIRVELMQKKAEGAQIAAISPGNYGLDFMRETYGYDLDRSVKCSNFIGQTVDMVKELGFEKMLLTGHIGKMIKVSGGIMNTHSKEGDCRMELLAAAAIRAGAKTATLNRILDSVSTEDATSILKQDNLLEPAMEQVMIKIADHLKHRAGAGLQIECMVYSNDIGLLGMTPGAQEMLTELLQA